ncbi:nuA3 HAT complex component nto1 [Gonapodya sp. JEL0774]|nr:nuA3 HAT complex component nto1 [Gonapodya sp. JEL0774]
MPPESEAFALIQEAEKKAAHKSWFGGNKLDEAAELFSRAANKFQLLKNWKDAGDAFIRASEIQLRMQEPDEAAGSFVNASKAYKKVNPHDSVHALEQAVAIYTDRGRFHIAAQHQKTIAEIYENDIQDYQKTLAAYQTAADWYQSEESNALANNCLLKVGTYAAQLEQYDLAVEKFEYVAAASVDNNLTKWSVREHLLKAGLCHLASGDIVATKRAVENYQTMDVTFASTREFTFLKDLIDAVEAGDEQLFTDTVFEFDRMTKLDAWKTTLLLRAKKSLESKKRKRSPGKKRSERGDVRSSTIHDKPREEESYTTYFPDLDVSLRLKVLRINAPLDLPIITQPSNGSGPTDSDSKQDTNVKPLAVASDDRKDVLMTEKTVEHGHRPQRSWHADRTGERLNATMQSKADKPGREIEYVDMDFHILSDGLASSNLHYDDVSPPGVNGLYEVSIPTSHGENMVAERSHSNQNGQICSTERLRSPVPLQVTAHEPLWTSDGVEATEAEANITAADDELAQETESTSQRSQTPKDELVHGGCPTSALSLASLDSDEDILIPGARRRQQKIKQRRLEPRKESLDDEFSTADESEDFTETAVKTSELFRKLVVQKTRVMPAEAPALKDSTTIEVTEEAVSSRLSEESSDNLKEVDHKIIVGYDLPPLLDDVTLARLKKLPRPSFRKCSFEPHALGDEHTEDRHFDRFSEAYIRYVEPTEAELYDRIEYDLDEQDKAWLTIVNNERRTLGEPEVPESVLEFVIDQYEKEWFDLTRDLPKRDQGLFPDDMVCAICDDGEAENANAIVFCDGCNLGVHQDCYGVPFIPEGQWLCRKCMLSPEKAVACIFCPNDGGAFKQTNTNRWGHLLCAMWIPEVGIANPVTMEPIDNIEQIPKSRWKLNCYICKQKDGCCIQCAHRNCYLAFHVTCARRAKLFMKMKARDGEENDKMLKSYCDKHAPDEWQVQHDMERKIEAIRSEQAGRKRKRDEREWVTDDPRTATTHTDDIDETGDLRVADRRKKANSSSRPNSSILRKINPENEPVRWNEAGSGPCIIPQYILTKVFNGMQNHQIRRKQQFLMSAAKYWALKREARRGAPLLKRLHLEDLEKVRMLVELVRKRERAKLKISQIQAEYLEQIMFPLTSLMSACHTDILKLDKQEYFSHPVSVFDVPDYLDVISQPMDLGTIAEKLRKREYLTIEEYEADLQLVWDNAITYNARGTPWFRAAEKIRNSSKHLIANLRLIVANLGLDPNLGGALSVEPVHGLFEFEYTQEEDLELSLMVPPTAQPSTELQDPSEGGTGAQVEEIDHGQALSNHGSTTVPTMSMSRGTEKRGFGTHEGRSESPPAKRRKLLVDNGSVTGPSASNLRRRSRKAMVPDNPLNTLTPKSLDAILSVNERQSEERHSVKSVHLTRRQDDKHGKKEQKKLTAKHHRTLEHPVSIPTTLAVSSTNFDRE